MAVTFQSVVAISVAGPSDSGSFNVGTGSNRFLLVALCDRDSNAAATTVQYAGVNLTNLGTFNYDSESMDIWYLAGPASGSNTLAVTSVGSYNSTPRMMIAIALNNVSQADPIGDTGDANTGTNTDTLVTTLGDWVITFLNQADAVNQWNVPTINDGSTSRQQVNSRINQPTGSASLLTQIATLEADASTEAMSITAGEADAKVVWVVVQKVRGGNQVIIMASRMREFLGELKRGLLPPDVLRERYRDLLTI